MNTEDVCVDMESTLANTHAPMLAVYNELNGHTYTKSDITHWDWVNEVIGFERFMQIVEVTWRRTPQAIPQEEKQPPVGQTLDRLEGAYDYDIVTARQTNWHNEPEPYDRVEDAMTDWLDWHGVNSYRTFNSIPATGGSKADLGYTYIIDDNPNLAEEVTDDQTFYLIEQPWNKNVRNHENVTSVSSISDAVERLVDAA